MTKCDLYNKRCPIALTPPVHPPEAWALQRGGVGGTAMLGGRLELIPASITQVESF